MVYIFGLSIDLTINIFRDIVQMLAGAFFGIHRDLANRPVLFARLPQFGKLVLELGFVRFLRADRQGAVAQCETGHQQKYQGFQLLLLYSGRDQIVHWN